MNQMRDRGEKGIDRLVFGLLFLFVLPAPLLVLAGMISLVPMLLLFAAEAKPGPRSSIERDAQYGIASLEFGSQPSAPVL